VRCLKGKKKRKSKSAYPRRKLFLETEEGEEYLRPSHIFPRLIVCETRKGWGPLPQKKVILLFDQERNAAHSTVRKTGGDQNLKHITSSLIGKKERQPKAFWGKDGSLDETGKGGGEETSREMWRKRKALGVAITKGE